ncbi:MAG: hypothetical protein R2822_17355 [Spirosomataceae bacterium]
MKKQPKKLPFFTEKIVALTQPQLREVQGGWSGIKLRSTVDFTLTTRNCETITGD